MKPLDGIRILTLAINLPSPLAVARLCRMGALAIKIEPPDGDALARIKPDWYRSLHEGQTILPLNLKDRAGRDQLDLYLAKSDLLITANRAAALERLELSWEGLHRRFPRLCHVAIGGYPSPHENWPGHDLTYQAHCGLITPPHLPRACLADWAGSQQVVQEAIALILARERGLGVHFREVNLAQAAESFADPYRQGLTTPGGPLDGVLPGYNLYHTQEGWIAVAALEPHFLNSLITELGIPSSDYQQFKTVFLTKTAAAWEAWAQEKGLPIAAVRE